MTKRKERTFNNEAYMVQEQEKKHIEQSESVGFPPYLGTRKSSGVSIKIFWTLKT